MAIIPFNSDKAADTINTFHKMFSETFMQGLAYAVEAGGALLNVKNTLKHGDFIPWCKKNLEFRQRTAQNYMKLSENKEPLMLANATSITEALSLIRSPEKDDDIPKEKEPNPPKDVTPPKKLEHQDPAFWYWDKFNKAKEDLLKTFFATSGKRTSTTPIALGWMIGNLKAMAQTIDTWDPAALEACPKCDGKGVRQAKGKEVVCEHCINGKVGHAKKSEY